MTTAGQDLARGLERARNVHRLVAGLDVFEQLQDLALRAERRRRADLRVASAEDEPERNAVRRAVDELARLLDRRFEGRGAILPLEVHRAGGVEYDDDVLLAAAEEAHFGEERTRKGERREREDRGTDHQQDDLLDEDAPPLLAHRLGEELPRAPDDPPRGALAEHVQQNRRGGGDQPKQHQWSEKRHSSLDNAQMKNKFKISF